MAAIPRHVINSRSLRQFDVMAAILGHDGNSPSGPPLLYQSDHTVALTWRPKLRYGKGNPIIGATSPLGGRGPIMEAVVRHDGRVVCYEGYGPP